MATIFQNPYIIASCAFIFSYIAFYCFNVGITLVEKNGNLIKRPGWKYPLAFAVLVWAFWALYLFPIDLSLGLSENPISTNNQNVDINLNQWF